MGRDEFANRVGIDVLSGAGNQQQPRRNQGQQRVLIKGQLALAVDIAAEIGAVPMRVPVVDPFEILAELASRELRRSIRSRRMVMAMRSSGASPERDFAQAGKAVDDQPGSIDFRLGFQAVEGAADAPGPGADSAVGAVFSLPFLLADEQLPDAVVEAVWPIRVKVVVAQGGAGIAAGKGFFKVPTASGEAAVLLGDAIVFIPGCPVGRIALGDSRIDAGVGCAGGIAFEIEAEESRRWSGRAVGQIQEQGRVRSWPRYPADDDFPPGGETAEGVALLS